MSPPQSPRDPMAQRVDSPLNPMSQPGSPQDPMTQNNMFEEGKYRRRLVYNSALRNTRSESFLKIEVGDEVHPRAIFVYGSWQCADILSNKLRRQTAQGAAAISYRMTPAVLLNKGLGHGVTWRLVRYLNNNDASLVKRQRIEEFSSGLSPPDVSFDNMKDQAPTKGMLVTEMTDTEISLLDADEPGCERVPVAVTVQARHNGETVTCEITAQAYVVKPENHQGSLTINQAWDIQEYIAGWEEDWEVNHPRK